MKEIEVHCIVDDDTISQAEKCLIDNGIDSGDVYIVLQALGYILCDVELYEE